MPLTSIEIEGYRGFQTRGVVNFALANGKPGSGLTILTGANNSGKSSILECLRARLGSRPVSFTVGARNPAIDKVEIVYVNQANRETIKSISKGSSETQRDNTIDFKVFVLPSRRAFNPYFGKNSFSRDVYTSNSPLPAQRSSTLSNFETRLFQILTAPERFNELLGEVLGFSPEWTIDQSDQGNYFLKFYNGAYSHSSDGMGEGIVSIFSIVDALYDSDVGEMIVVDEPELSLHPSLQKRLAKLLERFSADRQIVISTHSPYFASISALNNGAALSRVVTGSTGTKIHQLTQSSQSAIAKLSKRNFFNPHVFGLEARELFFQEDGIVLTEGQEDVLIYPLIAEQISRVLPGSFFGWGAGGANNIKHLCQILCDLGFMRVAALLDGDKGYLLPSLQTEFPNFKFLKIPALDVRTKNAQKARTSTIGLVDEKFRLREEFVDDMRGIFDQLTAAIHPE